MVLCVATPSIFIKTDSVKCRCWRPSLSGLTSHFYSVISIRETACKSGVTAVWNSNASTILDFAEENDVAIDFGCRAGNCGTCITAIKSGQVEYEIEPGATPEDGSCLTCCAVPKSSLVLDA